VSYHWSQQFTNYYTLSLPQPAVSSSAVSWQRLITVEILQLLALGSSYHSCPCRTLVNFLNPNWRQPVANFRTIAPFLLSPPWRAQLNCQSSALSQLFTQLAWSPRYTALGVDPTENIAFNITSIVVAVFTDPLPRNGRFLILLLHSNGRAHYLFRDLCPATGLYATTIYDNIIPTLDAERCNPVSTCP
jgi:hypothetical protein